MRPTRASSAREAGKDARAQVRQLVKTTTPKTATKTTAKKTTTAA